MSDIATPAERGSYVGAVLLGCVFLACQTLSRLLSCIYRPNVAPSLGPVLGGALVQYAGWRWIFWALAIMSSINLIVGNGNTRPGRLMNILFFAWAKSRDTPQVTTPGAVPRKRLQMPSLWPCIVATFKKNNALIMLINGLFYMTYCCVQASLSALFIQIYHFKELYAGLVYIPFGIGCALSSYTGGKSAA